MDIHIPFNYIPLKMEHIDYNIDLRKKLIQLSKNKLCDNIIFYGKHGCSKYIFMKCYLNLLYNNNNIIYDNILEKFKLSNKYEIIYSRTKYTYEFYDTENVTNNFLILKEIIYEICKNNTINNTYKIFIINDIDKFMLYNDKFIPYLIDKFHNIRIIGLSNKFLNIFNFFNIRCRCLNNFELYKILHYINLKEQVNLNYEDEIKLIKKCNYNVSFLLQLLNYKKFNIEYYDQLQQIVDLILTKDLKNYIQIKNIIQNIFIINEFSINEILETIFSKFLKQSNLDEDTKFKLVSQVGDINILSNNKYNVIDCLVFLLLKTII